MPVIDHYNTLSKVAEVRLQTIVQAHILMHTLDRCVGLYRGSSREGKRGCDEDLCGRSDF